MFTRSNTRHLVLMALPLLSGDHQEESIPHPTEVSLLSMPSRRPFTTGTGISRIFNNLSRSSHILLIHMLNAIKQGLLLSSGSPVPSKSHQGNTKNSLVINQPGTLRHQP